MKLSHMDNLYRPDAQSILLFKEVWALEKIHGTASGIIFDVSVDGTVSVKFSPGGEPYDKFVSLFNRERLLEKFKGLNVSPGTTVKIYGESHGGKQQGMSHTYGPVLKFIVFDVKIGDSWLDVPKADKVAQDFGLEFVHYVKVSTDLAVLDAWRDAPSVQAIRNGVSRVVDSTDKVPAGEKFEISPLLGIVVNPRKREGIVLRPLIEVTKNNGARVIAKHKGDNFRETKTPRPVVDPAKMKVLEDAQAVAEEWATMTRLQHVLDKLPGHSIERMRDVIAAMTEDIFREGEGEVVDSREARAAIGKKTAGMYKEFLKASLNR